MKFLVATLIALAGSQAFADLQGLYKITGDDSCFLQVDRVAHIHQGADKLIVSLFSDYEGGGEFVTFFEAPIGDKITRPDADMARRGAQAVRTIASYSRSLDGFDFAEYRYSPFDSDANGLKTGFFRSVQIAMVDNGAQITEIYNGGETHICNLTLLSR